VTADFGARGLFFSPQLLELTALSTGARRPLPGTTQLRRSNNPGLTSKHRWQVHSRSDKFCIRRPESELSLNLPARHGLNTGKRWLAIRWLTSIAAVTGMLDAPRSRAQSPAPDQAFEAASIKPNQSCGGAGRGSGGAPSPGRVTLGCAELRDLILTAYGIYASDAVPNPRAFRMQVVGGTGWIDSDRYDIVAKAEGDPPGSKMYGPMLRALLEDRFKLKVHREAKEAPVYLLTIAKGGAKLQSTKEGSCISEDINRARPRPAAGQPRPRVCGSQVTGLDDTFDLYGATMASLSIQLGIRLDRDVIDKTGIAGMFDIHLDVSRADVTPRFLAGGEVGQAEPSTPVGATEPTGPSIFTALQQQLGLKLESGQGLVEFLVIDHVEKPSGN
jgi:uncharacterized protein (TIGR03435 family)